MHNQETKMAEQSEPRYMWDDDGIPYRVELHGLPAEPPIPPVQMGTPLASPADLGGSVLPSMPLAIPPMPESPFQALHFYLEGEETPRYVSAFDIARERSLADFSDEEVLVELKEAKLLAEGLGFGGQGAEPEG